MNFRIVCGMSVWCSICKNECTCCMFTVSNALFKSNATANVHSGGCLVKVCRYGVVL